MFREKPVKGRPIVVRRLAPDADLKSCHILFVGASQRRRQREICEKLNRRPVLTVGDHEEFLTQGGMIGFVQKEENIRFNINLDPAQAAGLKFSSQLLKVALTVKGKYAEAKE
jgi:hypothetical protein